MSKEYLCFICGLETDHDGYGECEECGKFFCVTHNELENGICPYCMALIKERKMADKKMTKQEALEKLEKYRGSRLWLFRNSEGKFCIGNFGRDPHWLREAIFLFSDEQIEAAAEWIEEAHAESKEKSKEDLELKAEDFEPEFISEKDYLLDQYAKALNPYGLTPAQCK